MKEMSEGMKVLLQYAASLGPYNKQPVTIDKEDIVRLAKEAKLPYWHDTNIPCNLDRLEHFASLVIEHVNP